MSGELRVMHREAVKQRKSLILLIFPDISCVIREILESGEINHSFVYFARFAVTHHFSVFLNRLMQVVDFQESSG